MKKIICLILSIVTVLSLCSVFAGAETTFSDVKSDRWSIEYINYAVEMGYMNGVGGGKFNPAGTTTRGMAVTVLWRLCGSEEFKYSKKFSDVPEGKWYTTAVLWAANNNIVNGIDAKTFAPDKPITREQLAAIMYRFATYDNVNTDKKANIKGYSDYNKVSAYAQDALAWCGQHGLISGVTSTELQPKGNATREQFSAIMYRYDHAGYKFPDTQTFEYETVYNSPVPISTYTEKEYPLVTDADVYVSTTGSDSNDGSFEHPVATFEAARNLVRELKKTATDEIVVAFMAGEYGVLNDVTLTSEDSGTEAVPIKYCKYGDGDVVFNNGVTLKKSEFSKITEAEKSLFPAKAVDSIMKLSLDKVFPDGLPSSAQIFGADAPIWEARYPNKIDGKDEYVDNVMQLFDDSPNVYDLTFKMLAPFTRELNKIQSFKDAKLVGYIMYGWRVDSFYIDSYDKSTNLITLDADRLPSDFYTGSAGGGIRTPQMLLDEVYVSNIPDHLDDDGEYWYNKDTNTIYIYNPEDEYTIGLSGRFIHLIDADYITIEGLTFINCTDTAIRLDNSEHVTIDGITMSGIAGCVTVSGDSDWATIKNSEFSRFTSHCMWINPTHHRTTLESNNILIDNNYIHDFGLSTAFNNQAIADNSIGTVISHNYITNSPNGAINLGMLSIIEYNVFDNLMTCTQDFGIIYTWNAISTAKQNHIRYNLFTNMEGGQTYGNYMDDFTQDQYIYGNIFYECGACGVMLHNARNQFVYDNFFYGCELYCNGYGYYDPNTGKVMDGVLPDGTGWTEQYNRYFNNRINEGEEGYEVWKAQFPSLYEFTPDTENPTDYTSFFCPWDSIHNNLLINADTNVFGSPVEKYGDVHDNVILSEDENPYFVDPTHGDYTLKDGVTFFYIPFEKMGRY